MILQTIKQDSIIAKSLFYVSIIINLIHVATLPLGLGWTCQIRSLIPLFYSIDFINAFVLAISTLVQYNDEFGTLKDTFKDTFKRMINNGGILQLFFLLPWDVIPLLLASKVTCVANDQSWRIWIIIRALKIIPALDALVKSIVSAKIPYVSVQVGRLLKSMMGLLILVHMSACFFFILSGSQKSLNSWVQKVLIEEHGATEMGDQYIYSTYYAMGVLVFDTRDCRTDIEWLYSILELFIATVIYGAFFGMINSILKASSNSESIHRRKEYKYRYKQIKSYMWDKNFPKLLQDDIGRHEELRFHHLDGIDEKNVWKNLPKDLHQEIVNFLYGDILKSIRIFQDNDNSFISALALVIEPIHIACDTILFKVGDEAKEMYIILKGKIEITTISIYNEENIVRTCERGDYIGEVALLTKNVREVSAKTIMDSDLGRISSKNLDLLLMRFPYAKEKMIIIVEEKIRKTIAASMEAQHEETTHLILH